MPTWQDPPECLAGVYVSLLSLDLGDLFVGPSIPSGDRCTASFCLICFGLFIVLTLDAKTGKTSLDIVTKASEKATYGRRPKWSHSYLVKELRVTFHFTEGKAKSQKVSVNSPRSPKDDRSLAIGSRLSAVGTVI